MSSKKINFRLPGWGKKKKSLTPGSSSLLLVEARFTPHGVKVLKVNAKKRERKKEKKINNEEETQLA